MSDRNQPSDPQAREQSRLLPGKRAEDAGWAVVVPDEAVEAAARILAARHGSPAFKRFAASPEWGKARDAFRQSVRGMIAAAAPAIVAANQPKVEGDLLADLRMLLAGALPGHDLTYVLHPVAAFIAAQVAAAREEAEWLRNSRRDLITERDSLLAELRAKGGDRG